MRRARRAGTRTSPSVAHAEPAGGDSNSSQRSGTKLPWSTRTQTSLSSVELSSVSRPINGRYTGWPSELQSSDSHSAVARPKPSIGDSNTSTSSQSQPPAASSARRGNMIEQRWSSSSVATTTGMVAMKLCRGEGAPGRATSGSRSCHGCDGSLVVPHEMCASFRLPPPPDSLFRRDSRDRPHASARNAPLPAPAPVPPTPHYRRCTQIYTAALAARAVVRASAQRPRDVTRQSGHAQSVRAPPCQRRRPRASPSVTAARAAARACARARAAAAAARAGPAAAPPPPSAARGGTPGTSCACRAT